MIALCVCAPQNAASALWPSQPSALSSGLGFYSANSPSQVKCSSSLLPLSGKDGSTGVTPAAGHQRPIIAGSRRLRRAEVDNWWGCELRGAT